MARGRLWVYPCLIIGMGFLALTAPAWGTDEADARIKALEEQMARLQKELADLKAEKERPPVAAAAPAAPVDASKKDDGTPLRVFYKNGIKFKSDDGDFNLSVGGRVIENGRFFTGSNPGSDTFYNKETKVIFTGWLYKKFYYEFEGNLTTNALNESFVRYQHNDAFGIQVGQFKEPFWYEESVSTLWRDFAERSIGDRLAPSYDIGVQVQGKFFDKRLGYELGYFNGSGKNVNDTNDDKDWVGRLTVSPFLLDAASALNKLQVFGMFTYGRQNNTAPNLGAVSAAQTTDTGTQFLTFNANTVNSEDRSRLGFGAFWAKGPVGFKGEWETLRMDLQRTGLAGPIDGSFNQNENTRFDAWYATLNYVLTGEDANSGYDRLTPRNPWNKEGGYGAWEALVRFSQFQAEREPFFNLDKQYASAPLPLDSNNNLGKTGSATSMTGIMLGLNWTPIANAKAMFDYGVNYFGADYIGAPGADLTKMEKFVMLSTQFDF